MGRIPQGIIDQILDKVDIVEVVSEYVPLKKAGRNFKGCCPFHNEKPPSFVVSPDKQIFHCFGCTAGGNVIGFVMKYENLSFPEAIEMMAERAGIEIPKTNNVSDEASSLVKKLYEVNSIAAEYYQDQLGLPSAKGALDYLKQRGLSDATIKEFKIGYAPDGWENLQQYCKKKNISSEILRKAGLSVKSDKGRNDYDRFRNRITFPIFNERGNIVAFGARIMTDSQPKYLNSPETTVYSKSSVLYGLNFAKTEIRKAERVLIVEGYLDVIMPYQNEIKNIVATSGTALTTRQVALLKKHTDTAVMIFDADQAGEAASLRGLDILIVNGLTVYIATLPEGEDPDSFVKARGGEAFKEEIDKAKDLFDYKLDLLLGKSSGSSIVERAKIVNEMLPTISKVANAVIQSAYLEKLALKLQLNESALREEMGKVKPDYSFKYEEKTPTPSVAGNYRESELYLLGLAVLDKDMHDTMISKLGLEMFLDETVKRVMMLLKDFYLNEQSPTTGKILSRIEDDNSAKEAALQGIAKADIAGDKHQVLFDCIAHIRKENSENELRCLTNRLKQAEAAHDQVAVNELLTKISQLHKEKVT
jgi:DNA primase